MNLNIIEFQKKAVTCPLYPLKIERGGREGGRKKGFSNDLILFLVRMFKGYVCV